MTFNYFLITEDDERRERLILDACQVNSEYAIKKLLNENDISLDDYTAPVEVSLSLRRIGFKPLYKRKGTIGSVGIAQAGYEVITKK